MNYFYFCLLLTGALGCMYEGKAYRNGEEWVDQKHFKTRCEGRGLWRVVIFECITPQGVPVGGDGMECKTEANVKAMLDTLEKSNKVKCNDTEGEERDSGVEWQDGSIQYKCDENGEVAFVGCLTSTGELIPLGETKSVDGDEMECKTDATGKPVLEAVEKPMEAKCKDDRGRERDIGSEWTVGWFQFKCAEGGEVVLSGCFTLSGKLILKGERGTEDGRDLECKVDEKGSPFLDVLGKSSGTKCKDGEGKYRIQGEEWVEKNFQKVCRERGRVEVLGCRVEDVDELIPLNGKVSAGKYDHYCKEKDGGHLYYKTPKET